jgi:hypothetical protein
MALIPARPGLQRPVRVILRVTFALSVPSRAALLQRGEDRK